MKCGKEIVELITGMSGRNSAYTIFSDWVLCMAVSIRNACCLMHDDVWKAWENTHTATIKKYYPEEQKQFAQMMVLLSEELENDITDVLGKIYMQLECGSAKTGQFFTPFHLSYLTAELSVPDNITEKNPLVMNEPSCGGGGMILAAAKVLHERGINYQKVMRVCAQDLDWKSVYMTYVQLSLAGIDAVVVQGNTLVQPYEKNYPKERVLATPRHMGMLL